MVLNLKIIGYYGHYNVGDEQYKISFVSAFEQYLRNASNYTLDFYDCDKIQSITFSETDIIIIGGGDILNDYFLDKINKKFSNTENIIIGMSIGMPYVRILIETDKLNIIDYIFIRTTEDLALFEKYFFKDRVFYLPDLSFILSENVRNKQINHKEYNKIEYECNKNETIKDYNLKYIYRLKSYRLNNKNIVCFCLSRHIYNKLYTSEYENIIKNLSKFIEYLIEDNYHIVFLPFNSNETDSNENDIIINKDVMDLLTNANEDDITFIDSILNHKEIFEIFSLCDVCIPMRFHACLFSIYCKIPFLPIYTTRKVYNLLKEFDWEYQYKLPVNEKCIPVELDVDILKDKFIKLKKQDEFRKNIYNKLLHINMNKFNSCFSIQIKKVVDLLINFKTNGCKSKFDKTKSSNVLELIQSTYKSVEEYSKSQGYTNFRTITDDNLKNVVVSIVCYNLIGGTINSVYNYGLKEKMFDINKEYDYSKEWRWIINDYISSDNARNNKLSNFRGLINMKYIDQIDYSGSHRSGWQYVYEHLEFIHNNTSDLLLDLYLDRTFHWNREANKVLNIIPYKQKWIGFIHHTFDTSFSDYNCHKLLDCPEFIASLDTCQGLFVLSEYLKQHFESELCKRNLKVNIYALVHPTVCDVIKFSYDKFFYNKDKMIIHVGGWLRNVYSFYNLCLPESTNFKYGFLFGNKKSYKPITFSKQSIRKVGLKGKNMNNYYPNDDFTSNLHNNLITKSIESNVVSTQQIANCCIAHQTPLANCCIVHQTPLANCCIAHQTPLANCCIVHENQLANCSIDSNSDSKDLKIVNNWNKHFYEDVCKKIDTVNFITYLQNDDYDKLMTENIIFINLVDASAVNTVIECIVRSTPIVVNKHPAVVELLGDKYPLYFICDTNDYNSMNSQICKLLTNDVNIRKAHKYLKRLNIEKFKIDSFVKDFIKIIQKIKQ